MLYVLQDMATAASDVQNSSVTEQDNEPSLDVELLKETARKSLIDTLNAVRSLVLMNLLLQTEPWVFCEGKRREDARA